jgi:hypothetical protein
MIDVRFQLGIYSEPHLLLYRHRDLEVVSGILGHHWLINNFKPDPEELQLSPLFQLIGNRAYHYFLLFQCFVVGASRFLWGAIEPWQLVR